MAEYEDKGDGTRSPNRINAKAAQRMLGMVGRNYSDEELERLLDHLYGIAGSAFEKYLDTSDSEYHFQSPDPDITE